MCLSSCHIRCGRWLDVYAYQAATPSAASGLVHLLIKLPHHVCPVAWCTRISGCHFECCQWLDACAYQAAASRAANGLMHAFIKLPLQVLPLAWRIELPHHVLRCHLKCGQWLNACAYQAASSSVVSGLMHVLIKLPHHVWPMA